MIRELITEKNLIILARTFSIVFNPFYLPLLGLIVLFWCSYMSLYPLMYKFTVLGMVYLFTILLPTYLIRLYNNYHGWKFFELRQRELRMIPYIISIVCYFVCFYMMDYFHIPHFISTILAAALAIQMVCALINVWWNISTHSAGVGGATGSLIAFSLLFGFYLLWWLSLTLIISGMVASCRIILRQHTLSQVIVGYLVGLLISMSIIIFI